MIYCDASLLVASLVDEVHSVAASDWLRAYPPDQLAISDWTLTEVRSALAFKLGLGAIGEQDHRGAMAAADQLFSDLTVLSVERRHFEAAGRRHVFAPPAGLRAGDALHLAIVIDHDMGLATLDTRFAIAAEKSGVHVDRVLSPH